MLTCHVLAGVVAHALHDCVGAGVAHAEALCRHAAEVGLSLHAMTQSRHYFWLLLASNLIGNSACNTLLSLQRSHRK